MRIINHTQDSKYNLYLASNVKLEHSLIQTTDRYNLIERNAENFITKYWSDTYGNHLSFLFLSYANTYLNLFPVVFVTKAQSRTSFFSDFWTPVFRYKQIDIPSDKLQVPNITDLDLLEQVESERFEFKPKELDLWGIYTFQNGCPIIFIWTDKIFDYAKKKNPKQYRKYYELHVCQTILHEVMHALMDVDVFGNHPLFIDYYNGNYNKALYDLKEESLAEAGSIALMKKFWSANDIKYLLDFVEGKNLLQYSLGAKLYRAGVSLIDFSVNNWAECKINNHINMHEYKNWVKYVACNQKYDLQTLIDFEYKIFH